MGDGLDGQNLIPEWVSHFSLYFWASRPAMRLTQPMGTGGGERFPWVKVDEWSYHSPPRMEQLYLHFPMSSWHCAYLSLGRTWLHLPLHHTNFLIVRWHIRSLSWINTVPIPTVLSTDTSALYRTKLHQQEKKIWINNSHIPPAKLSYKNAFFFDNCLFPLPEPV
jgi:hypothetical protein